TLNCICVNSLRPQDEGLRRSPAAHITWIAFLPESPENTNQDRPVHLSDCLMFWTLDKLTAVLIEWTFGTWDRVSGCGTEQMDAFRGVARQSVGWILGASPIGARPDAEFIRRGMSK